MTPSEILGDHGPFSKTLDGFIARKGQQDLSDAIDRVVQDKQVLIAEAGTGIGKTFAYLVPVLVSGKKALISTGTRHLQDQLFHRDLPVVKKTLHMDLAVALLKGRSNYLCLHRVRTASQQGYLTRETQDELQRIRQWGKTTLSGDIAEVAAINEDARVWPMVTSTVDNCLGAECADWNDCFVVKARREAQEADIVVVNHHLLLADMAIKEEGFGDLLPSADVFVIDEAHQLPEIATRFFGKTISSRQINMLVNDVIAEQLQDAADMSELRDSAEALKKAAMDFRLAMGLDNQRDAWLKIRNKPDLKTARQNLQEKFNQLNEVLELAAERGKGLENCYARSLALTQMLMAYGNAASVQETEASEEDYIYWYETFSKGFVLYMTPLDVAGLFRHHQQSLAGSWIFTSATLQVGKDFGHFAQRLGIQAYEQGCWDSPFDYQQQSLLYIPQNLPEPSSYDFTAALIEQAIPVIEASEGRAFILFTSYRALNEAQRLLQSRIEYPLLVQGSLPKHQLLQQFKQLGNAVLLGTGSFWEGVDVRGEALSCVIIDKLPFASPGDPVMQARLDAIRKQGGNPFMDYQVPQAVIALKQGAGRLIRDTQDHGVLMLGDTRLINKHYGKLFLNSLPAMPMTRKLDDVCDFFEQVKALT
ncbi:MAG: ATP-dependent DNA helicase [Gammaproteobacteria bacterium]|nr:MAG: ATP-dependent DNA helicase [Gammaproteobacteria bacterium]